MLPPVPVTTHTFPESLPDILFLSCHDGPRTAMRLAPVRPSVMNSELSREVGAAVDKNCLTVYVGAVVREQERHHGRDVLWRAEPR